MRKPLEVWHFIIALITLVMSAGTLFVNLSNKVTNHDTRLITLEQKSGEVSGKLDRIDDKMDKMQKETTQQLTNILVELQNKKDRNN